MNRLKQINDRYGHITGSKVIKQVVGVLQKQLCKTDKIFRFGGDEFVVTLPGTNSQQTSAVVQRLRHALNHSRIQLFKGVHVTVTAAFGVATYPSDGTSKERLIRHADEAMYQSKRASASSGSEQPTSTLRLILK